MTKLEVANGKSNANGMFRVHIVCTALNVAVKWLRLNLVKILLYIAVHCGVVR